jgi:hypothetical protein
MKAFRGADLDLSIRDRVKIECACGRTALIAVQGLGQPAYSSIKASSINCGARIVANAARCCSRLYGRTHNLCNQSSH